MRRSDFYNFEKNYFFVKNNWRMIDKLICVNLNISQTHLLELRDAIRNKELERKDAIRTENNRCAKPIENNKQYWQSEAEMFESLSPSYSYQELTPEEQEIFKDLQTGELMPPKTFTVIEENNNDHSLGKAS